MLHEQDDGRIPVDEGSPPNDDPIESDEDWKPVPGKYTFDLFYKSFRKLDSSMMRTIYNEFVSQGEMESRKHESYIQRQGILFAFSSLILIESILNIDHTFSLSDVGSLIYATGIVTIVLSMLFEVWGILSSYTYPQIGMHLWDLEDRVIAGDLESLEEDMIEQYLRSLDWYIYCNEKLRRALIASSIILVVGAAFVMSSIVMGV
ncbi:hypothetical protein [Candidatus Methanoprimaticola sp. MG2]|uniref:hypothetical protein n=1 Tax=Candidatus Methanoprimaticola sp. MG2 TaxID=3228838 RepID=UPI0039C6F8EA